MLHDVVTLVLRDDMPVRPHRENVLDTAVPVQDVTAICRRVSGGRRDGVAQSMAGVWLETLLV